MTHSNEKNYLIEQSKTANYLCSDESLVCMNLLDDHSDVRMIQSPYYFCTVTCCESESCIDPVKSNSTMNKFNNHFYEPYKFSFSNNNSTMKNNNVMDCEFCFPDKHTNNHHNNNNNNNINNNDNTNNNNNNNSMRILWADSILDSNDNKIIERNVEESTSEIKKHKLKLKSLINNNNVQLSSPEMSSSPIGNNSSNTEYTEICTPTPLCTSNNRNSIIRPLLKITNTDHQGMSRHSSNNLDYRVYFINDASKHGFFRKAVPILPLAIAVVFCILNLILPGSGTFLASVAIVFGSQTEYGPRCGYQAFLICFLSSILQFATAILVFGWVWSIMWGIVFIKNSLRYGQKRDIHTISLC